MFRWIIDKALSIMTGIGVLILVFVAFNWATLSVPTRMLGLFSMAITLHVWEEMKYPGGFVELTTTNMGFTLRDVRASEAIVVLVLIYISVVPLFFPSVTWLVLAPMILGLFEAVAHVAIIRLFHIKKFYSPGMVTAVFLLLPISVYTFYYLLSNRFVQPLDWLYAFLYMFVGLVLAQRSVIHMNGFTYGNYLSNVRAKVFGGRS